MMNTKISKDMVARDLKNIGICSGDVIFITADLLSVGLYSVNRSKTFSTWMCLLREVVGPEGTVIVASYTATFPRFKKDRNVVFHRYAIPNTGALAAAFLEDKETVRSSHPTNSYIGFGPQAKYILEKHDLNSKCYSPIGKIIELRGKNLLLGTLDKKNGPIVFHYVQEQLGITTKNPYCNWLQTYYIDNNGQIGLFTIRDCGGCSRGAHHLYGSLLVNGSMKLGTVGRAKSALIDCRESFDIIKNILINNRKITLCDDKNCLTCYGNSKNVGFSAYILYIKKLLKVFKKLAH